MANKIEYTAKDCSEVIIKGKNVKKADDSILSHIRDSTKNIYCYKLSKCERDIEPEPIVYYDYNKSQWSCLLYTSDAADDLLCVDLGGSRIIKKKKHKTEEKQKIKQTQMT